MQKYINAKDPNEIVFIKKIPNARALSGLGDMIFSSYEKYKPGKYLQYFLLTFMKFILVRLKTSKLEEPISQFHIYYMQGLRSLRGRGGDHRASF